MKTMTRTLAIWMTLLAFTMAACSTTMNIRSEDYARIEPTNDYRIVTKDDRDFEATNLVIKDGVASFVHEGKPVTVPIDEIALIQQVNNNEILTGVVGLGIVLAIVGGLVVVLAQD